MKNVDLRAYVFLDSLQPQYASFLATIAQGYLPTVGQASLFVEISPGIEINRVTDIALKFVRFFRNKHPFIASVRDDFRVLSVQHRQSESIDTS